MHRPPPAPCPIAYLASLEIQHSVENLGYHGVLHFFTIEVEHVPAVRQSDEFVGDTLSLQFLSHQYELLDVNIGVLIALNQQSRWVIRCDIADWAEWVEPLRFFVWIMSRQIRRPNALLTALKGETPSFLNQTPLKRSSGDNGAANRLVSLVPRHSGSLSVERVRSAIPCLTMLP